MLTSSLTAMALSKKNLTIIIIAFVTVFLDMMNNALIVPILPFLVIELHSNEFQEGFLFSVYSITQLISKNPIIKHTCRFVIDGTTE